MCAFMGVIKNKIQHVTYKIEGKMNLRECVD